MFNIPNPDHHLASKACLAEFKDIFKQCELAEPTL